MITKETVQYVADLARLSFDETSIEKFTKDMEQIIGFADKLGELDTEGVNPTAHSVPVYNVFREDEVKESFPRNEILENAPEKDSEYFVVPKVVE